MKLKLFFLIALLFSTNSFAVDKVTLALNWKPEPEFGGFYAAQILGHFKKQGLEVTLQQGGSGTPTVQMLANGKVEFAIVSADEIIISHERNPKNKVMALFAVYQKSPYVIMTHQERQFANLKSVWQSEGVLSIQSGLPYYQFLVKKFGPPKAKIVPYLGGVGNFLKDPLFSQQGFISTEPATAEKQGVKVRSFPVADEGFNPYLVVLAAHEKTLKEKPELVKKMLTAIRQGWKDYRRDPQATNKHMASLNKALDLETFNKGAALQDPFIEPPAGLEVGTMSLERWASLSQQLRELGLIRGPQLGDTYFQNF